MVAKQQTMARSRVPVARVQLMQGTSKSMVLQMDEPVECPLCIETLDDTDRDFFPCPCGYQVCLFCYQRLQSEYNNTCPGCRQQYSDDLDAVRQAVKRKHQQQQLEAASRPAASTHQGHAAHHAGHSHAAHGHGHNAHGHSGQHGHGHAHAQHHNQHHGSHGAPHAHAAHGLRPAVAKSGSAASSAAAAAAKQRHMHHDTAAAGAQTRGHEPVGSGLPATANWVNAAGANSSVDSSTDALQPTTVDDDAWPSLGEAVASTSSQQQQQQQHSREHAVRRQSSSSSLSSMHSHQQQTARQDPMRSSCDSTISTLTGHNVEQQQSQAVPQQEQQNQLDRRTSTGFTAVEVTTVVAGARHSVCVPVSNHSEVSPFPEAATLLEMLQQAVSSSKLSSTEAAVQLVQCLRKLEADNQNKQQNVWLQQVLANGHNGTKKPAYSNGATAGRPPTAPQAGSAAARAPPPGFGGPAKAAGSAYTSQLQQQDLGAARGAPYRPVSANSQQQHQILQQAVSDNYASQSSMHSVDSNSSLFSQSSLSQGAGLWTDNGLPGVDFGAGVGGLGSAIPAAVPARLQMLWAGTSSGSQSQAVGSGAAAGGYAATVNPPPGFSNGLGLGNTGRLANGTSRLLNGSYNPLSYADVDAAASSLPQAATNPPPEFNFPTLDSGLKQQSQQSLYRPWA